jgi:class 3 adenylate cyclase
VADAEWTLLWVSSEMKTLLGTDDPEALGIGHHLVAAQLHSPWRQSITRETELKQIQMQLPMMIRDTPGGLDALARFLPDAARPLLEQIEPVEVPVAWSSMIAFVQGDLPPARVRVLDVRLGPANERLGVLRVYGSDLPAHVLALVGRGDEGMFERMARMFEPRRRGAAILFADLEGSGILARRLASDAYFDLIRELTTRIDELVISRKGVVGKHAGDGVTAFFVVEDFDTPSATARTAIEVGRSIGDLARQVAEQRSVILKRDDLQLNVGMHWGDRLYMGQVVTGGRIEVTALGDEVNESARIEQSARDGQILGSKNLVERLDADDASALTLDPARLTYEKIAELSAASDKSIRDAGGLAVTDLRRPRAAAAG